MTESNKIYDELKSLDAATLLKQRQKQRASISKNYFKEMCEVVMLRTTEKNVPADYFNSLGDAILSKIENQKEDKKIKRLVPSWAVGLAASLLLALIFIPNYNTSEENIDNGWAVSVTDDELISYVETLEEEDLSDLFDIEDADEIYDVLMEQDEDLDALLDEISDSFDEDWEL